MGLNRDVEEVEEALLKKGKDVEDVRPGTSPMDPLELYTKESFLSHSFKSVFIIFIQSLFYNFVKASRKPLETCAIKLRSGTLAAVP